MGYPAAVEGFAYDEEYDSAYRDTILFFFFFPVESEGGIDEIAAHLENLAGEAKG